MKQNTDNSVVEKVLQLVLTSARTMPAHYSSNGDRTQSFCIDFDIDRDDEYNLASFAFYKGYEALAKYSYDPKPTDLETSAIIKLGEDIIIGSYIMKKVGDTTYLSDLMEGLAKANDELVAISQAIRNDKEIQDYFAACRSYGLSKASTLQH